MMSNCLEGRERLQEGPVLSDASVTLKWTTLPLFHQRQLTALKTLMHVILKRGDCLQPALLKSLLPQ